MAEELIPTVSKALTGEWSQITEIRGEKVSKKQATPFDNSQYILLFCFFVVLKVILSCLWRLELKDFWLI